MQKKNQYAHKSIEQRKYVVFTRNNNNCAKKCSTTLADPVVQQRFWTVEYSSKWYVPAQ